MKSQVKISLKKLIFHPILILFLLNSIFFSKALFSNLFISTSDSLQRFPSFNIGEFYKPLNSLLFDTVTQFQVWDLYYNNNLLKGVFPLWNNFSSNGVPFFANMQSALLFPLKIIYLIIPLPLGQNLFYFFKIYLISLFTYLYLREIKIGKFPSLIGAVAFAYCGFNVTWLMWPQTNVVIFLPLFLYLIERLFNRSLSLRKFCFFYSISLCFAVFGGHPETLFHISLMSIFYFLYKLHDLKNKFIFIKVFILSNLFGFLFSSIQTIPFIEYLINSWALFERQTLNIGNLLPMYSVIYNIFPNISGNPASDYYHTLFNQSYNELVGAYVGPIISLFSIACIVLYLRKDKNVVFFSFLGLLILPFIYRLPLFSPMALLISKIIANTRLQFVLAFIQSILASVFINRFIFSGEFKKLKIINWIILVSIIVSPITIKIFLPNFLKGINIFKVNNFIKYLSFQTIFLEATLLFALILITGSKKINKSFSYLILTVLVFMQTGLLNINYNPVIEKKYYYPQTEDIKFLMNLPKGRIIEAGGDYILPPNTNLIFDIPSVENYDALEIKYYKSLFDSVFNNKTSWGTVLDSKERYFDLFGIKYILSDTDIDKFIVNNQTEADSLVGEVTSNKILRQEFIASEDKLYGIRILPANYNRKNNCRFSFNLFEQASNKLLFQKLIPCEIIFDKIYFDIDFPVINNSKIKKYRFEINVIDGISGNTISFWKSSNDGLVFSTKYDIKQKNSYQNIFDGKFKIFENKNLTPDFYLVDTIIEENNINDGLSEIFKDEFDSRNQAVLIDGDQNIKNSFEKNKPIEIVKESAEEIVLNIKSIEGVFLASKLSYYPGWRAYIDKKSTKIYKTNIAFQGIYIPAGEHIISFKYQPLSFRIGIALSLIGVISLLFYIRKNEK